jgi:hypothetical protein
MSGRFARPQMRVSDPTAARIGRKREQLARSPGPPISARRSGTSRHGIARSPVCGASNRRADRRSISCAACGRPSCARCTVTASRPSPRGSLPCFAPSTARCSAIPTTDRYTAYSDLRTDPVFEEAWRAYDIAAPLGALQTTIESPAIGQFTYDVLTLPIPQAAEQSIVVQVPDAASAARLLGRPPPSFGVPPDGGQ